MLSCIKHCQLFGIMICDDILVLNFGVMIAEGAPREIQNSPQVIEAYLGTDEDIDY